MLDGGTSLVLDLYHHCILAMSFTISILWALDGIAYRKIRRLVFI